MLLCAPWYDTYIKNWKTSNLNQETWMNYSSIISWSNKINNQQEDLGNIDLKPVNQLMTTSEIKNCHPCHNLPQTYRGSKYVCTIWIRLTENFITHPRKNFRINKSWSSKCNKHQLTINKIRIKQITWRIF